MLSKVKNLWFGLSMLFTSAKKTQVSISCTVLYHPKRVILNPVDVYKSLTNTNKLDLRQKMADRPVDGNTSLGTLM